MAEAASDSSLAPPAELVSQLGFYFSDSNLRRDRFLIRLTGADGTGAVPIETLATFNRVAAHTQDVGVIVAALRQAPGLVVSDDEQSVRRVSPLPDEDTSAARTVYVEQLPAGVTIDMLREAFGACGAVTCVSLPRSGPSHSRDALGFAFVEFETEAAAAAAPERMGGTALRDGQPPLRVMRKAAWEEQKAAYKSARAAGSRRSAKAERAKAAAAEAERAAAALPQTVVAVTAIARGGNIKAIRKEMNSVFGAVAPVEFVDYGFSNSGDPTVAYVRMETEEGAAEAVRLLSEREQPFGGAAAQFALLRGEKLLRYTDRIRELRAASGKTRQRKRQQWWERKWGAKAAEEGGGGGGGDGGGNGDGDGDGGGGDGGGGGGGGGGMEGGGRKADAEESGAAGARDRGEAAADEEGGADGGPAQKRQKA